MTESTKSYTTDELFSLLEMSGLLNDKLFETQKKRFLNPTSTPKTILLQMIADNLLTPFQAKQLSEKRHRGFFLSEKYKILDFLGQGGMSRVLLCEHLMLQRLVAVKILNKSLDKFPGAAERFLREARASASMDHPNIARVFDVDRTVLGPSIVMEFVDGSNLHDIAVKGDLLSISRVAHYISQAANGLQQAHQAGLVHRDVKPANLMLDRSGTVKLLDLGLARFFDPNKSDNLTVQIDASCIIGTADYIAPEQVMESSSADIRADIYSLGYSMYFLLTRTPPAGTGAAMRKLLWHQTKEPEPIRNLRPDVPKEMAAVLERMIRKKPDERFQTPIEVVKALAPWTAEPIAPPIDAEMPRTKGSSYRLGLCPPPDSSKLLGTPSALQSPNSLVQPSSNKGSSTIYSSDVRSRVVKRPSPGHAGSVASTSENLIEYNAPKNPQGSSIRNSKVRSPNTNEVMSESTETDTTPGSSVRNLAHSAIITVSSGRFWLRTILMLLVLSLAAGGGGYATYRYFNGLPKNPEIEKPADDAADKSAQESVKPSDGQKTATPTNVQPTGVTVRGGGSTFIKPAMDAWTPAFGTKTGIVIEYKAEGSSAGVEGVRTNFLDFGCSDAYMSDEKIAEAGGNIIHIPMAMGAVVPTYNLTDSQSGEQLTLNFTGPVLAKIYLGQIKRWNDPAIAVSNPGLSLPDMPITVVYRSDGSGTTAIWTQYLSKSSANWKKDVGFGNKVNWPIGVGKPKSNGVADEVSRTTGSIGYVEMSYALANGLSMGNVKNQSGSFIKPSVDAITAAASASLKGIPDDLRFDLTDALGTRSYPIIGTCWAILRTDQTGDRGVAVVKFLQWVTTEGQSQLPGLQYGRLPEEFNDKIKALMDKIVITK